MIRHTIPNISVQQVLLFSLTLLLLFLFSFWRVGQAAILDQRNQPLQFSAAGHVLGFQPDGYYVAGGDHVLHVGFVGATGVTPRAAGVNEGDSARRPLNRVTYDNLWSGINLRYETAVDGIARSTWEIAAGAHVEAIRLRYNTPLEILPDGSLKIAYEIGWMHESAPIAWQEIGGIRHPVEVAFRLAGDTESEPVIGFELGRYDAAHPLLIDPTLVWNTTMGSGVDSGWGIAVDRSGNVYVAGRSDATWGSPLNPHAGDSDAFVAKLNSSGQLQWNTFMGSASGTDVARAIAVDDSGNLYITGDSNQSWGSPYSPHQGGFDAFAARLNSSGALQWNTFMGSASSDDFGFDIAADSSGHVYVAGRFGFFNTIGFAIKLTTANGTQQWSIIMGSMSGHDEARGIAVDGGGSVYIAGWSTESWGAPVNDYSGYYEAFVAKLNSSGDLQWNTFMGGSTSGDYAEAISLDGSGNLYVAGASSNSWGAPLNPYAGGRDVFIARLNSSGARIWNTFMGSAGGDDEGNSIAVDRRGNLYVAGNSNAAWGMPVNPYAGGSDAFIAGLKDSGALRWNTFMGSASGNDEGNAIVAGGRDNLYVAGSNSVECTEGYAFAARLRDKICSYYFIKAEEGIVIPVCL